MTENPSGSWLASGRAHVRVQPGAEWAGGPQEAGDPAGRRRGAEPGFGRPLLPGNQPLVPEQLDPGVVGRVATRGTLQRILAVHLDAVPLHLRDHLGQFLAAA